MKLKDLKNLFSEFTNVKLVINGTVEVFKGYWNQVPAEYSDYLVELVIPIKHPDNDKLEVKNTAEDLLIKIIEYVNTCDIPGVEKSELALEMACSLITTTVDIDDDIAAITSDVNSKFENLRCMALNEIIKYKSGNCENIKYEFEV